MPSVKDTAKTPVSDDTVDVEVPTYPTPAATIVEGYAPVVAPGSEPGAETPTGEDPLTPGVDTPVGDGLPGAEGNKSMSGNGSSNYTEGSSSGSDKPYINGLDGEQESTNAIGNTAAFMTMSAVVTCLVAMSSAMLS